MGLHLKDDEFNSFFKALDANGDGVVTRKEFTDTISPLKTPWPKIFAFFKEKQWRAVALKQMFTDLDQDHSGGT